MKTLTLLALLLLAATADASCKDDMKTFKVAQKFGAYDFTCKDKYDGRTSSSWSIRYEDYKRYREHLAQARKKK